MVIFMTYLQVAGCQILIFVCHSDFISVGCQTSHLVHIGSGLDLKNLSGHRFLFYTFLCWGFLFYTWLHHLPKYYYIIMEFNCQRLLHSLLYTWQYINMFTLKNYESLLTEIKLSVSSIRKTFESPRSLIPLLTMDVSFSPSSSRFGHKRHQPLMFLHVTCCCQLSFQGFI